MANTRYLAEYIKSGVIIVNETILIYENITSDGFNLVKVLSELSLIYENAFRGSISIFSVVNEVLGIYEVIFLEPKKKIITEIDAIYENITTEVKRFTGRVFSFIT